MYAIKVLPKGQITLPKEIRKDLGIKEGDAVVLEQSGNAIILKKGVTIFDLKGMLPGKGSIEKAIEDATEKAVRERV